MSFLDGIVNIGKNLIGGGKSNPIIDFGLKLGKEFVSKRGGGSEADGTRSFMQLPEIEGVGGVSSTSNHIAYSKCSFATIWLENYWVSCVIHFATCNSIT